MAAGTYRLPLVIAVVTAALAIGQSLPAPPAQPATAFPNPPIIHIREIHARQQPTLIPGRFGQRVTIRGVVAARAVDIGEYTHLPIQGEDGYGLLLERERGAFTRFAPGDKVLATGTVRHRAGAPILAVESMVAQGHQDEPSPVRMRVSDVARFENSGKVVTIESFVITPGKNSGGDVLVIGGDASEPSLMVFYPRFARWNEPGLHQFEAGDRVRVTGIASQYCPVEPYDRGFQVVVNHVEQVTLLERGWVIPPGLVLYLVITLLLAAATWWTRERRMADQRRTIRSMMALSEEVLSSNRTGEISRKVQTVLPALLNAWSVDLFLLNKLRNTLDRIPSESAPDPLSIAFEDPKGAFASAVSLCYRNRTLLNIPDFRKSPIVETAAEADLPAAAVFVPMFAQGEILGVIAASFKVRVKTNSTQQTALQHVANQIAASLKLQEQQSIREQLLRTEKMAAAGQLISGVVHDLRAPLNAIRDAAARLSSDRGGAEEVLIVSEADRGLQIMNHLLAFARMERSEARPINLHELVSSVMEARETEWKRKAIQLENALPLSPVEVLADESELEQVFLSLLVHVEHAVENHSGKSVRLSSRVLGNRIQISIEFSGPTVLTDSIEEPAAGDSFGLRVCQAIAQSHGGDIRLFRTHHKTFRYEFELPVYHAPVPTEAPAEPVLRPSRVLTAIILEQDAAIQRRLLAMMSLRGHRAIPVDSAEEAADMVQRLPFDLVFCTIRLPGSTWTEFFRRIRKRISAFVLLTEDYDPDATGTLRDGAGFVLRKPVNDSELELVLAEVEARQGAARP